MRTYISHIIFSITCNFSFTGQYDEQWRMVYAHDEEEAIQEAKNIGKHESGLFVDRHGRTIGWELVAIKEVKELEIGHGKLMTSKITDTSEIAAPLWQMETV